ncbi:hypothetical protein M514_13868 [Trichuris suis]|uniref:CDC20/Fizzy WD40 domain-containing protein n=1 Tax=Trichuris suis TaxID=68888 RepID=A0A085MQT3_9BILA|nr:hypothetical protein M513_13868 [Trichuris suis]KFD59579.1 hypothetical protein M514_13868 [Trichuris suis]
MSQEGSVSRSTTTKEKGAPSMRKFSRGKYVLSSTGKVAQFSGTLPLEHGRRKKAHKHPVNLAPLRTCDSNKLPLFPTHHLFPLSGSGDRFPPLHSLGSVADGETPELQTNIVYKTVITELLSDSQKNAGRVDEKLFPLTECEDEINVKVPFEPGMLRAKAKTRTERSIPHYAEKIFDAPNIREDFYLNVVDWSYKDVLAVGLDQDLFVCTLRRGDIIGEVQRLGEYDETNFISAVRFSATEDILAIALNSEDLELWNVSERKRLQTLCSSGYRVGCLSWNGNILTAGDKGGQICHHDMRLKSSIVAKYVAHKDDVCGLEWSPNGRYLASGGNDNRVQIYSHMAMKATPVLSLSDHQAAVKAIAWSPSESNILATGGGSDDRKIKIWNIGKGICLRSKDTGAQVTGLLWSEYYNELASCNGLPSNRVVIWTYPHLNILKRLKEHSNRILSMVMSPCGEYVLTAAADESIRVWHVFDKSGKYRVNCRASTGSAEESLSELMKLVELDNNDSSNRNNSYYNNNNDKSLLLVMTSLYITLTTGQGQS